MQYFDSIAITLFMLLGVDRLQAQSIDTLGVDDIVDIRLIPPPETLGTTIRWREGCQRAVYCVQEVASSKGRVEYRPDLEAYVVVSSDPNNPPSTPTAIVCGQWTGILCNWPQASHWVSQSVLFSGKYYQARDMRANRGGETVFYLHVNALRNIN